MQAGQNATRPSALAVNPDNERASIARRIRLLRAFRSLPEDAQADLIECAETVAFAAGRVDHGQRRPLRDLLTEVYVAAGWDPAR